MFLNNQITKLNKIHIPNIYLIYVFCLIYFSNDTLIFGTVDGASINTSIIYSLIILSGLFLYYSKIFKNKTSSTLNYLMLSIGCILFTGIFNINFSGGYFYQILIFVTVYIVYRFIPLIPFLLSFRKVIYILSFISIITYFIVLLFPVILSYVPIVENIVGVTKYNFYLSVVNNEGSFLRNSSIFREPGVYMMYLILALIVELYLMNKFNTGIDVKYIFVILFALLLTFSTGGYLVFLCFIIYYLLHNNKNIMKFVYFFILGSIIWFLYNIFSDSFEQTQVLNKLQKDSTHYGSTLSRISSIIIPLKIFSHNILVGSGLDSFSKLYSLYSWETYQIMFTSEGTSTNTILNKFATYGLLSGTLFSYAFYKLSSLLSIRKKTILLFIIFLLLFSNEDVRYSLIFNILPFYALDKANYL